ncbi:MAG: hypothetical protein LBS54_06410 [Dysgonamonadaceae bacterium]|jgi:hypothetical protein|nr:hypothetical protein [Dysgonamonadaceae bacterium]
MRINWKKGKIECCGLHEICERNHQSSPAGKKKPEVEYYDDEELDAFAGRSACSYSGDEAAVFREIFDTMPEADIKGWLHSLEQRGIALPETLGNSINQYII